MSMKELASIQTRWTRYVPANVHTGALLLCALAGLAPGGFVAAAVNPDQRNAAAQLADTTPWIQARSVVKAAHPLGVQTLSIEKQENKNLPDAALLRVYQFHYDLQQARLLIVSPDNRQVLDTQLIDSVHLPLNDAEISYATTMLMSQGAIVERLHAEQTARGRLPFGQLSDLDVKASIYEPLNHNDICYHQRCALLSLFDDTRTVFANEPVVNLQSLDVRLLDTQ